jgi:type I restriction enzyme S subunit
MTGAGGLKRVPDEFTRNFKIPFPPLADQERIANFLDEKTARIDALIAEKERLVERLDELRLSEVHSAVSIGLDPSAPRVRTSDDWFIEVPANWNFCPLNYRYEVQLGKMLDEKRITGEHLVPYLRNTDVQWDRINVEGLPLMDIPSEEHSRYLVRPGDLLVCEGGEVGRAAIWGGRETAIGYQKALHRVRPRSLQELPRFMFYALYDSAKRGRFEGREKATIAHLTAEAFRRYRFAFPPFEEQAAIVRHLDARFEMLNETFEHCHQHIDILREYRSSLISAAVTGQLNIDDFLSRQLEAA